MKSRADSPLGSLRLGCESWNCLLTLFFTPEDKGIELKSAVGSDYLPPFGYTPSSLELLLGFIISWATLRSRLPGPQKGSDEWSDKANKTLYYLSSSPSSSSWFFFLILSSPSPSSFFFFFLVILSPFSFLKVHVGGCYYNDTIRLWSCECWWFQNCTPRCIRYRGPLGSGNRSHAALPRVTVNAGWVLGLVFWVTQSPHFSNL